MILTTTDTIEGRPVKEYRGIVTGESVVKGTMNDLSTALSNMGSGKDPLTERYMVEAKESALKKLEIRAQELGANAIIGVHLSCDRGPQSVMVSAIGTAVVIP